MSYTEKTENTNFLLYSISNFTRYFSIGVFLVLFNIYIINQNFSEIFLGIF